MGIRLDGKVALVTASSEGLGFACAKRLAEAGCAVAICARRKDILARARDDLTTAGGPEVLAVPADLANPETAENLVDQVLEAFGRIDILVLNSGHIDYGGLEELSDSQWRHAFELLLMSVVRLTRRCVPIMRASGSGDIVLLGSSTIREPPPHLLLSTVMRLGVAGLAKTLARSLAPDNIRVNLVAPGYFDTGRVRRKVRAIVQETGMSQAEASKEVSGGVPMGRLGSPGELAELVAFVVSRKAGFMTGATLTIDGGGSRALF
jgi:3-oxoacyl-[acyl-carrier protein] reductase